MRRGTLLLVMLLLSLLQAQAQTEAERAGQGIQAMQRWYVPATGLYKTTGWWNSANAITTLVGYSRVSGSKEYLPVLVNTLVMAQNTSPGFLNDYYDDEGWWALAWIDAYDLTGNKADLAMGESIFADMTGAWDDTCSGGIWWSRDRKYKNAIANELFLSVAAHLANRIPAKKDEFRTWADREWAWFAASGMINDKGLVNDGLKIDPVTKACTNNGHKTWSYNQGVVLGGLVELSQSNPDPGLKVTAKRIALAAITALGDKDGVMRDGCEPAKCGADATQFKGIFARNLGELDKAYPERAYKQFLQVNANAVWSRDRDGGIFGVDWPGPYAAGDASTTSSALDVLVARAEEVR